MGRKRRRKSQSSSPDLSSTPADHEEHFHTPFQDLKASLAKANAEPSASQPAKPSPDAAQLKAQQAARERALAQQRAAEKRAEREFQQRPSQPDEVDFLKAMADVQSLAPDPRGRIGKRRG